MAEEEADVIFYPHADKLSGKKMKTVAETLDKINTNSLLKKLARKVSEVKFKTLGGKLVNVKAKTLFY